jgi:acyl-CoA dehydrogenase
MNSPDTQGANNDACSELQTLIADSVERLFSRAITPSLLADFDRNGFCDTLWQRLAESGLPHALVPEHAGGSGASLLDASPVLRAIGYWQVPLPLGETLLATALLARAGVEIPEGPISLIQGARLGDVRLAAEGRVVEGRAGQVPWSRACRWAVVADAGQIALVDLRHASLTRDVACNFANEQRDTLCFARTPVVTTAALTLPGISEPVWLLGALLRVCTSVGALESALDKAVSYANERIQFGKPIGRQQALQQLLAQMAGAVALARMSTHVALGSASDYLEGRLAQPQRMLFDIAAAKVCAGEAATLGCSVAHQVHGSIGFTHEHSLHPATRRLWSWREEFGSDAQWARVLGSAAIAAGAPGFWSGLVERDLWRRHQDVA